MGMNQKSGPNIVRIAALIGDHARAEILTTLMAGQALTATELAHAAAVTKQTASANLSKRLDARLVAVESQGRHRYFRLADGDVARLLENLMGVARRAGAVRLRTGPQEPALRKARVCYDHLAGELGVRVLDSLVQRKLIRIDTDALARTTRGTQFCTGFGIDIESLANAQRTLCRHCLDWSVRRHHLAGALGAAVLARCYELGWARRLRDSRVVSFSIPGERALTRQFPLAADG